MRSSKKACPHLQLNKSSLDAAQLVFDALKLFVDIIGDVANLLQNFRRAVALVDIIKNGVWTLLRTFF